MRHPSSYRDPSGFIFEKEGILYRQVNQSYREHFDLLISSGFYEKLVSKGLLIPHETINTNLTGGNDWYLTLKPRLFPFISYPYEWSFDMLKDAALLTLQLVRESIASGMILKDATPYNIQFNEGKPIFIDTLSFEKYNEQEPWIAYRQFCESFLAPLLLSHYSKHSLHAAQLAWPEGIPLAIAKSLLPGRTRFSLHIYLHIHLHANVSRKNPVPGRKKIQFSKQKLLNLISSLEVLVKRLRLPEQDSTWNNYYAEASQRDDYLEAKKNIIGQWINRMVISTAIDMGANDGEFSRLLASKGINVIAADFDPYCINRLYLDIKNKREKKITPMIVDLSNPSPAIGVNNEERSSLLKRWKADLVLALALIHHLAIGKNIPFEKIATLFKSAGSQLIIEYVPKEDDKIQQMLSGKKDIYTHYKKEEFESVFKQHFTIMEQQAIASSGRILYYMKRNEG